MYSRNEVHRENTNKPTTNRRKLVMKATQLKFIAFTVFLCILLLACSTAKETGSKGASIEKGVLGRKSESPAIPLPFSLVTNSPYDINKYPGMLPVAIYRAGKLSDSGASEVSYVSAGLLIVSLVPDLNEDRLESRVIFPEQIVARKKTFDGAFVIRNTLVPPYYFAGCITNLIGFNRAKWHYDVAVGVVGSDWTSATNYAEATEGAVDIGRKTFRFEPASKFASRGKLTSEVRSMITDEPVKIIGYAYIHEKDEKSDENRPLLIVEHGKGKGHLGTPYIDNHKRVYILSADFTPPSGFSIKGQASILAGPIDLEKY